MCSVVMAPCFCLFQTCASVALQTSKDSEGLLSSQHHRRMGRFQPNKWLKLSCFALIPETLLDLSDKDESQFLVKRGRTSSLGATPPKGTLTSSLRYQQTIYLLNYFPCLFVHRRNLQRKEGNLFFLLLKEGKIVSFLTFFMILSDFLLFSQNWENAEMFFFFFY